MASIGRIALVVVACVLLGTAPARAHHDLSHTSGHITPLFGIEVGF
jgi:hypothetical protein